MGAEPEADVVGAEGEAVNLDGYKRGCGAGGSEFGFPDHEVVVSFHAEFVREERGVVDGAAGFDDEVFEEEIQFRDGYLEAGDRDVLDCLDEEGDEDMDGVVDELFVCGGVERGEDVDNSGGGGDEF